MAVVSPIFPSIFFSSNQTTIQGYSVFCCSKGINLSMMLITICRRLKTFDFLQHVFTEVSVFVHTAFSTIPTVPWLLINCHLAPSQCEEYPCKVALNTKYSFKLVDHVGLVQGGKRLLIDFVLLLQAFISSKTYFLAYGGLPSLWWTLSLD